MNPRILNYWRMGCITGAFVLVMALLYIWQQTVVLKQAEVVYRNPRTRQYTRTIRVQGPVQIRTRIIERPSGEKETEIVEERGSISETQVEARETAPVPLAETLKPARTDRVLLGLTALDLDFRNPGAYRLNLGYSLRNSVDLLAGVGYDDHVRSSLSVILRF